MTTSLVWTVLFGDIVNSTSYAVIGKIALKRIKNDKRMTMRVSSLLLGLLVLGAAAEDLFDTDVPPDVPFIENDEYQHRRKLGWRICNTGNFYCVAGNNCDGYWCRDEHTTRASCLGQAGSWCWSQSTYTALTPSGRCRTAGGGTGSSGSDFTFASNIDNLNDCKDACDDDSNCVAIEYDSSNHCELWTTLPVETAQTSSNGENCLLKGDQNGVQNGGEPCWTACGSQGGSCTSFCGPEGLCCRFGTSDSFGCDGTMGIDGVSDYVCVGSVASDKCSAYAFTTGVQSGETNGCVDGGRLEQGQSCTLRCMDGYTGADGTVSCDDDAANDDAPDVDISCAPIICAAISLPGSLVPDTVTYSSNVFVSNAPGVGGWGGRCDCPDGTSYDVGDNFDFCASLACIGGTTNGPCNQYNGAWSENQVTCGQLDPCTNGMVLSPLGDASCNVKCGPGTTGSGGTLTCASDAAQGSSPTVSADCVENLCAAYLFGTGVVPGDTNPCSDGVRLSTYTTSSCRVKCDVGYEGEEADVICSSTSSSGDLATSSISCSIVRCAPYDLSDDVVPTSDGGCTNGIILNAGTGCGVQCAAGYRGDPGEIRCPMSSSTNDAVVEDVLCEENRCAALAVPSNLVPHAISSDACVTGVQLSTQSPNNECDVQCAPGYASVSDNLIVTCASDASEGDLADTSTASSACVENRCSPYTFPDGVMRGAQLDDVPPYV